MGTADYCLVIVVLFFGLVAWSLLQEDQRKRDRRQVDLPPPGGIERRVNRDRRSRSWVRGALWALRTRWARLSSKTRS